MLTRTRLWLASLLERRQFDRDLADELTFHLQARAEHLRREGVPAREAERQARLEFGNPDKYTEEVRDVRTGAWLEQLHQDVRYGLRLLVRRPGVAAAAILTLALGIGATVAVISETMARRYWAGRGPIGTHLSSRSFGQPVEIVGIARDIPVGLDGTAEPFVYLPLRQHPRFLSAPRPMVLLARAESNPPALAASMRSVLREVDPSLPVTGITTLDAEIAGLLMPQRLGSTLLSTLSSLTVVLVTVGVVGTVGYGISRRRREIGVRLALGARRAQVVGAMTRGALVPVAAGVLIGLAGAAALGSLVSSFLYGIEPTDIVTLTIAIIVIALFAGLASFVPAWRASGVNPTEVLRAE